MKRVWFWLCASWLLAACPLQAQTILVRAGAVYPVVGESLHPGAVLIDKGRIQAVAAQLEAPSGASVMELPDATLIPGLVQAFTQSGLAAGAAETTHEITPRVRVRDAIDWRGPAWRRWCDAGVTTVCLCPNSQNVIGGMAAVIKTAGESASERLVAAEAALVMTMSSDPADGNTSRGRPDSIYVRQPTNRMGVVWMLRSSFDRARRDPATDSPLDDVLSGRTRVLVVSRTDYDIRSLLTIANEFGFHPIVVGGQESYRVADLLAEKKVPVILEPLTTAGRRGPEGTDLAWNVAGILHRHGVELGLTGDDPLEQARFAVRFGLPLDVALRAITLTPARLLGVEQRVGGIAAGMDADLVCLDGDPGALTTRLRWVMVNGRIASSREKQ